ncbi:MAG: hypothetical protein J6Y49_01835 [Alphaproteobacteria bacterium]|nr:hypothetical protein [Alphaproteobacteria bacterium]
MKMSPLVKGQILAGIKNPTNNVVRMDNKPKESEIKDAKGLEEAVNNLTEWLAVISPSGQVLLELNYDINQVLLHNELGKSFLKVNGEKILVDVDDFKEIAEEVDDRWRKTGERWVSVNPIRRGGKEK